MTLTAEPVTGGTELIPVSHRELISVLRPRDRVLLADGEIELKVLSVSPAEAECVVVRSGILGERKGVTAAHLRRIDPNGLKPAAEDPIARLVNP